MKGSEEQDEAGGPLRATCPAISCPALIGRPAGGSSIYDAAVRRMTRDFLASERI